MYIQCSLTYPDHSLIQTPVWESIPIPQQKVTRLYGNSVTRTVSLGTEVYRYKVRFHCNGLGSKPGLYFYLFKKNANVDENWIIRCTSYGTQWNDNFYIHDKM